jgi:hypothetical protein
MRVRFGGTWIADSENDLVLFEPGRYPVAYFPKTDISPDSLQHTEHTMRHSDLGLPPFTPFNRVARALLEIEAPTQTPASRRILRMSFRRRIAVCTALPRQGALLVTGIRAVLNGGSV